VAFDEGLAQRVREALADRSDLTEKKMFGGEMDSTGRAMRGMVYVGVDGTVENDQLTSWLEPAVAFAGKLPAK
jgi:hypothetical protein